MTRRAPAPRGRAAPAPGAAGIIPGDWKAPVNKIGKKRTINILGTPKKIVFTKLKGKGDANEFYVASAYVRSPVPWDTTVHGPSARQKLSQYQIQACSALKIASQNTANVNRVQRKTIIGAQLRGAQYNPGRLRKPPAPRLTPEQFAAYL